MQRLIQNHDLLPLKREIVNINHFISSSPLSFDYIDFLENQKIDFCFKQQPFNQPMVFDTQNKNEFIKYINSKNFGFFEFKDNEYKQLISEYFLDTFVGKNFHDLEKIFAHIDIPSPICEFYRTLGLIALNKQEKNFYQLSPVIPELQVGDNRTREL